jgi:hypothetical protein
MTTPADVRTDEEAFAACLAGRPVPAGAQGLAAFTDAVRAGATEPGRPNAALAELLATGLLVPTQEPSPGTAGRPARTSRKRPHVLISTLVAKFAAAGALAKTAAAGGVVAVALTGAATAGTLPGQDGTTAVVQSGDVTDGTEAPQDPADLTPSDDTDAGGADPDGTVADDSAGDGSSGVVADEDGDGAGDAVPDQPVAETPEAPVADPAPESPETSEGQRPTDAEKAARHPDNHGATVSAEVHQRNADRKAAREAQPEPATPEDGQAVEVLEAEQAPVVEQPAPAGDGKGKGNGKNGK